MNARPRTFSQKIASRPVQAALAIKIALAILGANASFAAAKALLSRKADQLAIRVAPSVDSAKPFIIPVNDEATREKSTVLAKAESEERRTLSVKTGDGCGFRGSVTRVVCGEAL